jgi:hypothetical protein
MILYPQQKTRLETDSEPHKREIIRLLFIYSYYTRKTEKVCAPFVRGLCGLRLRETPRRTKKKTGETKPRSDFQRARIQSNAQRASKATKSTPPPIEPLSKSGGENSNSNEPRHHQNIEYARHSPHLTRKEISR